MEISAINLESKLVPELLAEMVWCIKFRFLLLNIYFRSSGFQARALFRLLRRSARKVWQSFNLLPYTQTY